MVVVGVREQDVAQLRSIFKHSLDDYVCIIARVYESHFS
jgi:hypothetical protein